MNMTKVRLGEFLIKQNLLNQDQLEKALELQKITSRKLGKVLVELGFISEEQIAIALSKQLNCSYIDIMTVTVDKSLLNKVSEMQARKFKAVPIEEKNNITIVAMSDPTDLFAYDELVKILKKDIEVVIVTEKGLLLYIEKIYSRTGEISSIAKELEQDIRNVVGEVDLGNLEGLTIEETPVVRLLQSLFDDAIYKKASDIHIEPQKDKTFIRFRIDGVLMLHSEVDLKICPPLISRLKIMSGLDISERRLPQDGRLRIKVKGLAVDVRISTLPLHHGEGAVMRLLVQKSKKLSLDSLGIPDNILEPLKKIVYGHEGMLLVTGPTGSGKTTTLYSALSDINTVDKKIITIEDPVEYNLDLINQVQANDKIGLSFGKILRAVLRQDPDVIMIGEVRDDETAQIALRGAITGHLILSTIHTKDTISTPIRLIDMGVPGYMVAGALQGVLAQRLIRTSCKDCLVSYTPSSRDEKWFRGFYKMDTENIIFKHGSGCNHCNNTGYTGRTGLYELLEIDEELMNFLYNNELTMFNMKAKEKMEGKTMADGVKNLVLSGLTTVEEAKRMIG